MTEESSSAKETWWQKMVLSAIITTTAGVQQKNKHRCQQGRLTRLTVTQTVGEIIQKRNHTILKLNRACKITTLLLQNKQRKLVLSFDVFQHSHIQKR